MGDLGAAKADRTLDSAGVVLVAPDVDMALVRLPSAASARGGPSPPAAGRRARVRRRHGLGAQGFLPGEGSARTGADTVVPVNWAKGGPRAYGRSAEKRLLGG
jgi:hypothetical protein